MNSDLNLSEGQLNYYQAIKKECKEAEKQILFLGVKIQNLRERILLLQWIRTISELRDDHVESLMMKHEYLEYLRVTLSGPYKKLTKPFDVPPPDNLVPFSECISNRIADLYQDFVPRAGPLQPVMCHKSEDNRAYLCVKRTPDNGILCYMCCAPDANANVMSN